MTVQAVVGWLVMTQTADVVTVEAVTVVAGLTMGLGVGSARREGGDAFNTAGDRHCQQEEKGCFFHGGCPWRKKRERVQYSVSTDKA